LNILALGEPDADLTLEKELKQNINIAQDPAQPALEIGAIGDLGQLG